MDGINEDNSRGKYKCARKLNFEYWKMKKMLDKIVFFE